MKGGCESVKSVRLLCVECCTCGKVWYNLENRKVHQNEPDTAKLNETQNKNKTRKKSSQIKISVGAVLRLQCKSEGIKSLNECNQCYSERESINSIASLMGDMRCI